MWSHNSSNFSTGYTLQQNTILLGLKAITTVIIQIHYDKTDEKLVREHILTIRWLMTAVRALWSPLKQCKLRARHSKRAWLHICKSLGPKDSSERGKGSVHVRQKRKIKVFLCLCVVQEVESVPVQRRMCVAKSCSCCLKKDMLVWVTSTPSRTVTEDSLWGGAMEMPHSGLCRSLKSYNTTETYSNFACIVCVDSHSSRS